MSDYPEFFNPFKESYEDEGEHGVRDEYSEALNPLEHPEDGVNDEYPEDLNPFDDFNDDIGYDYPEDLNPFVDFENVLGVEYPEELNPFEHYKDDEYREYPGDLNPFGDYEDCAMDEYLEEQLHEEDSGNREDYPKYLNPFEYDADGRKMLEYLEELDPLNPRDVTAFFRWLSLTYRPFPSG